ncbi:MAG TPA: hypothetical protein PLP83_00405 [Candidatus Aminicenantes bacterium]|nr:hypothetical protein [Candidatus Aminicenantes bacterium]
MVKSAAPVRPAELLCRFAEMSERSRSADGDRQGDGWGFCGRDGSGRWREYRSLRPIWKEERLFAGFPAFALLAVHARSASFPGQTGNLDYIQPYFGGGLAFVFNGLLRGVSLGRPVAGEIGAQKIWRLFGTLSVGSPLRKRLAALVRLLERSSREIPALNLGLAGDGAFLAYSRAAEAGDYYRLWLAEGPGLRAICSEPLRGRDFRPLPFGRIHSF